MKIVVFEYMKNQYIYKNKPISIVNKKTDEVGKIIKIKKILFLFNNNKIKIGRPYIDNKEILFKITKTTTKKKKSIKFKRRKRYRRFFGYKINKTIIEKEKF